MAKEFKRYLVTSALPYANGPVHIGHLAGVYIPSDIYTRYLRRRGRDVLSICGSDEHGVAITIKARKEGVSPKEIIDRYHNLIKRSFERLGMSFDIYSRTSSPVHAQTASDFFRKLYAEGKFIEKTSEQYYDEEAQQFLADRYIVGTCPHCQNEKAYGDQCEKCGSTLSPDELIAPHSALSGSPLVKRETKHWYLPLDKYEGFLREWILEGHKEWRPNVYGQCKSWLDLGLQPRAVSRDLDWGIPVPVEGAEGKVLYVWFDAPIGYISATKELTPDWERYWKDSGTKMVHFIGKDNIVFHCIVFPSMLKAHGEYILPENVPANEFLNLEGDKISTSRNWAVWLHEYLDEFPGKEDVLRYVLCANAPESKDNDFTWKDFQARNNNELVAVLGNFVNRALVLTQKYYGGEVPACGSLTDYDRETLAELQAVKATLEQNIENYRFREALKEAMKEYSARDRQKYGDMDIGKTAYPKFQEKLQVCRDLFHGYDFSKFYMGSPLEKAQAITGGVNFVLDAKAQKRKELFAKEALLLRQAQSLCSSMTTEEERHTAAYFEAVRSTVMKITMGGGNGKPLSLKEINSQINELLKASIQSEGVINLFESAKMGEKFSLFDPAVLEEIARMKEKNIVVEILRKLMAEQIAIYKRTNVVQATTFSEKITLLMNTYYNGLITNEEVIKELLKTAEEINALRKEGEKLGLSEEELAFYDALTKPEHIKDFYENETLIALTRELTDMLRRNRTIDWQKKETARAGMRKMVKRLLKKYKYPPEKYEDAIETVMSQCELWTDQAEM